MKETTRQIVLLFGILTLLTSSYIVVSMADNTDSNDVEQPTTPEINNSNNITQNSTMPDEPIQNDPAQTNSTGEASSGESRGLIENAIRGVNILINDMGETMAILSTESGNTS